MREIVFDTETTGIKPSEGHRIVEIGCVELVNYIPTGKTFHVYLNPERDMPSEAEKIHGLSSKFLADKPLFAEIADEFLAFLGKDKLVAHNAGFDLTFLNAELRRIGRTEWPQNRIVDTLALARQKFGSGSNSLDALCKRFNVDLTARTLHGALLDCELLAQVYLELKGGRQFGLTLEQAKSSYIMQEQSQEMHREGQSISPAASAYSYHSLTITQEEEEEHASFTAKMPHSLWLNS